jgi:hypothetical protein
MNPIERDPRYRRAAAVFAALGDGGYTVDAFRVGRTGTKTAIVGRRLNRLRVVRVARVFGLKPRHMAYACRHQVTARHWEEAYRDSGEVTEREVAGVLAFIEPALRLALAQQDPDIAAWVEERWQTLRARLIAQKPQPKPAEMPE